MHLKLPEPCLVVLVGPSASGKTTWALDQFAPNEVVSSDALRAIVGAGEDDQRASTAAFEILERVLVERMTRRLTTVVDTTGFDDKARQRWVGLAHSNGIPAYAVVFESSFEQLETRNGQRSRAIPKSVLRRQLTRFHEVIGTIDGDGFDGVFSELRVSTVTPAVLAVSEGVEPEPPKGHTFGLLLSRFNWEGEAFGNGLSTVALRAERAGFADIWLMDHFRQIAQVGRPWEDIPEVYTSLGYLAAVTTRLRLGALVSGVTHRNPVLLGKMVATLDVLSGGRAICGLGAAWDRVEHAAYGLGFPPIQHRYDLLEDTLQLLPLLWGKGSPAFEGKTISAKELICYPRPIQERIPIMVGGSGEKKTLRLVAKYADACNLFGDPERVRTKVDVLHDHCEEHERDPTEVRVTHLLNLIVSADRKALRSRVDQLRNRNTSAEEYASRARAVTVEDAIGLVNAYVAAGADHTIVALGDVSHEGSIEAFAEVIAAFDSS